MKNRSLRLIFVFQVIFNTRLSTFIQSCHAKIGDWFTKLSCRVTRTISSLRFMIFVQESLRIFEDFLPQAGEPVGEGNRIESIGKVQ